MERISDYLAVEKVKKLKQREREIRGIPESIRDIIINDYEPRKLK